MSESPLHSRAAPRKAPKQARSLATVEAIVEAAARILEERGHEAFSTNAVAEKAGVSVGSLYQYFPRKDALIGALILRETSRLVAEAEIAADKTTGSEALSALILPCVEQQLRRPAILGAHTRNPAATGFAAAGRYRSGKPRRGRHHQGNGRCRRGPWRHG